MFEMKTNSMLVTAVQTGAAGFDMFRLSKSKETVDICSNTLRNYHAAGLPFYRQGKAVFISRAELVDFIKRQSFANAREA